MSNKSFIIIALVGIAMFTVEYLDRTYWREVIAVQDRTSYYVNDAGFGQAAADFKDAVGWAE